MGISSGPSGHQHSQSQRCCCLFAPYFVIQIRMIHWYRKLQEYSKLTEKSILIWQENGRGNMLCDEKLVEKKHNKSCLTELKNHSFKKIPPGIINFHLGNQKNTHSEIFFFREILF